MAAVALNLTPVGKLTEEAFYELCLANPEIQFERTANGELIIVTPVGGEGGSQEAGLIADLVIWNRRTRLGEVFSSSTIFMLPNGAERSPDVAWVQLDRWQALTPEQRRRFPPLTPDFVIELRSPSDRLKTLQEKMQEYLENGLRLGWLINPQNCQVEIYRPGQAVERLTAPTTLSGEDVLPGFGLDVGQILKEA
jgi:Uma2 family endonuclease